MKDSANLSVDNPQSCLLWQAGHVSTRAIHWVDYFYTSELSLSMTLLHKRNLIK